MTKASTEHQESSNRGGTVKKARSGKKGWFSQSEFPLTTLQDAQRIPSAIEDNFAGESGSPPDVALALGISPTSSVWRSLTGSSIAYGLTEGGFGAVRITLGPLGKRLVAPQDEGDDVLARREAIMQPRILREFFERYRRAKFPSDVIGVNVLKSLGVPANRAETALKIAKANGHYAGIIREAPTGLFVNLDSPTVPAPATTPRGVVSDLADLDTETEGAGTHKAPVVAKGGPPLAEKETQDRDNDRVFISHGKQKAIVEQIKELLTFGNFTPVISVERESTAIPVPEKVFEDIRSCGAGVIHVTAEGTFLDKEGKEHLNINDNVLIEIGAALATYGKKVVLLVQKGLALPSNLQGLYRCDYEGEQLDYDATMKLLKTFNQFR